MYIWALDLSLRNSGFCVFDDKRNILQIGSIPTTAKDSDGVRLKTIADSLIKVSKKFPADIIIIEKGFFRFYKASQQLNKVLGLVNYLFWDIKQVYYAPTTIKKTITGSGKAKKEEVKDCVLLEYPNISIENDDESDALAVGLTYFKKTEEIGE